MIDPQDPRTIVEYRAGAHLQGNLPQVLWLCALGALLVVAADGWALVAGWALLAVSAGLVVIVLIGSSSSARPVLRLSPEAITAMLGGAPVVIPWPEVRGVETISFSVMSYGYRLPRRIHFKDTTFVLVSPEFYGAHIEPGSLLKRGPYWTWTFRPVGELMGVALDHVPFGAAPQDVRGPVEARWRAFGAGAGVAGGGEHGEVIRIGDGRQRLGWGQRLMLIAPLTVVLVLFANAAGLWETPAQRESRMVRADYERRLNADVDEARRQREAFDRMMDDAQQSFEQTFPDRPPTTPPRSD